MIGLYLGLYRAHICSQDIGIDLQGSQGYREVRILYCNKTTNGFFRQFLKSWSRLILLTLIVINSYSYSDTCANPDIVKICGLHCKYSSFVSILVSISLKSPYRRCCLSFPSRGQSPLSAFRFLNSVLVRDKARGLTNKKVSLVQLKVLTVRTIKLYTGLSKKTSARLRETLDVVLVFLTSKNT